MRFFHAICRQAPSLCPGRCAPGLGVFAGTDRRNRGAGAYQFTGHTIYEPLVAWESNIGTRPGKLVPGLATKGKPDVKDPKKWTFTLRPGVKFHDGSALMPTRCCGTWTRS
jgi:ABC-type transport system substrate-binding protein